MEQLAAALGADLRRPFGWSSSPRWAVWPRVGVTRAPADFRSRVWPATPMGFPGARVRLRAPRAGEVHRPLVNSRRLTVPPVPPPLTTLGVAPAFSQLCTVADGWSPNRCL